MIDPDEDYDPRDDAAEDEDVPVGRCCVCGTDGRKLPNIVQLHKRMPTPGKGWGCFVCGLPQAGAVAVVCEVCMPPTFEYGDKLPEIRLFCAGYAGEPERLPYESLTEPFEHDMARHAAYEVAVAPDQTWRMVDQSDGETLYRLAVSDDPAGDELPEPFVCSGCRQPIWMPENPPILAWPVDRQGEPIPDPDKPGDIQMLRLCDKCATRMIAPQTGGPE